jgi:hypothetical protein
MINEKQEIRHKALSFDDEIRPLPATPDKWFGGDALLFLQGYKCVTNRPAV